MKINNNTKYMLYIILFIIFILIRINYVLLSGEIEELSFKGLAISRCFYPFETIKEAIINTNFLPFYYLFTGILRHEITIKIFNILLSIGNIYVLILIGKKLLNDKLGYFLAILLAINHFYIYHSNIIAPYVLTFLIQSLTINSLIDYFKKPNRKHFRNLNIFNFILILTDIFGFIYVISELILFYILSEKRRIYKFYLYKFINYSFIAFLIILPILFVKYIYFTKYVVSPIKDGVGFNFSSLYLMLNEYFSPYLSFLAPENQSKSTLGLIYSYFMNPDIKNINSLKLLIVLFYSSILPLIIMFITTFKVVSKNLKLKFIFYIVLIDTFIIFILMLFEKIETTPIYTYPLFLTLLIIMGYGIFKIKDSFTKIIIIFCITAIQFINPNVNSFNILIKNNYPVLNPINLFIKENSITKKDLLIIPNQGKYASLYFKNKATIFNYDEDYLKISKRKGLLRNLSNKSSKKITKNNIHFLMQDYLSENKTNYYLSSYFINEITNTKTPYERIILIVDKLNAKPISPNAILKCANDNNYEPKLRKIDFRYFNLNQSDSDILFDSLRSKTLYNLANSLTISFQLASIVEYKKLENEYYKIPSSMNIYKALSTYDSDYVFLIFE